MRRLSIRWVLTLTVIAIALAAMLIISSVYSATATSMFNQLGMSSMLQAMEQVSEKLSLSIGRVTNTLLVLADDIEREENFNGINFAPSVRVSANTTDLIESIMLLDEFGNPIMGVPKSQLKETCRLTGMDWYQTALDAPVGQTLFSRPHVQSLFADTYPWVVSVTRKIHYQQNGEQLVGLLMVDMRMEPLSALCQSVTLGSSGCPFIMSENEEVIFHPDQKLLSLELIAEETLLVEDSDDSARKMVLSQDIEGTSWKLVGTVLASDIAKNSDIFNSRMASIVMVLVLVVSLVAVWLSTQIVRPLTEIQAFMQRIERNLDDNRISLPEEGFKEYAALSHSYNIMLHKIRGLMRETVDRQAQLRNMEISALQEQINPHFLYNTLDSIIRVLETNRTPEAIEMIQALAKLFRLSINNGDYYLTVAQEMDYARSYLTIQQVRYRKKFKYQLYMDEQIKDLQCPKIILQPLIENSIKHGVSDMPGCTLVVRAKQEGYNIVFTVEDDGLGIPPHELEGLQQMLKDDRNAIVEKSRYGIGLRNTNRRIQLIYGKDYGLTIESEVEERTCVTVTLPKRPY